jgi:hypothetical protein
MRDPRLRAEIQQLGDTSTPLTKNSSQYIYNSYSMAMALFHKRVQIGPAYTCWSSPQRAFDCGIAEEIKPDRSTPLRFREHFEDFVVFEGELWDLCRTRDWGNALFITKQPAQRG